MRIDAEPPTSLTYGGGILKALRRGGEQGQTSRALCEVIVTLGRDDALRHAYLRKPWQGLPSNSVTRAKVG